MCDAGVTCPNLKTSCCNTVYGVFASLTANRAVSGRFFIIVNEIPLLAARFTVNRPPMTQLPQIAAPFTIKACPATNGEENIPQFMIKVDTFRSK